MNDAPTQLTVRRADLGQSGELADLWLRSRTASIPEIPPPVHDADEVRLWFAEVVLLTDEVWIAENLSGEIVGLLVLKHALIDQLYVDPHWMGQGIGSRLVNLAKEHNPHGLHLWTFRSNEKARSFYEKRGFRPVGETDCDNEESAPDICYRWGPD